MLPWRSMAAPDLNSFLAGLGTYHELDKEEMAALTSRLEALATDASRIWPKVILQRSDLLHYLGEKLSGDQGTGSLVQRLDALPQETLLLAHCCAMGSSDAILEFEKRYFGLIAPALRRLGLLAFLDEVEQRVRDELFVPKNGAPPRVAALAGNGDLGALVKVIATRMALNLKRRDTRFDGDGDEQIAGAIAHEECPGDAAIKAQQQAIFKSAFQTALSKLDDRSRSVLRMHLLHRMNISQIAELYDVHRATTARWLGQIRDDLGQETRKVLRKQLELDAAELDSLMKVAQSKIEISFDRLLETQAQES